MKVKSGKLVREIPLRYTEIGNEHVMQYCFPEMESKIFYRGFNEDGVGTCRRPAHPGLPEGSDEKILHRQVFRESASGEKSGGRRCIHVEEGASIDR